MAFVGIKKNTQRDETAKDWLNEIIKNDFSTLEDDALSFVLNAIQGY
jgi:hypothetical protein